MVKLYKCISGENEGSYFVKYSNSYRQVCSGKINRYPYFQFESTELVDVNFCLEEKYNNQVKINFESLSLGKDKIEIRKALVIANRIINFEKSFDQFHIDLRKGIGELYNYDVICLTHTQHGNTKAVVAEITISYDDNKIYIIHEGLHKKNGTRKMDRSKFDHVVFGYEYKKDICFSELHLLNNQLI